MNRRFLSLLLVLPGAVAVYACSSSGGSGSSSGDIPDASTDTTVIDNDSGPIPGEDGGGNDAGDGSTPNSNPITTAAAASVANVTTGYLDGPIWRDNSLFFSSYFERVIVKLVPASGPSVFADLSGSATTRPGIGQTFDGKQNALLRVDVEEVAAGGGALVRYLADGGTGAAITPTFDGGVTWESPNDVAVRASDGLIYVTDPGYQKQNSGGLITNKIFRIQPSGSVIESAVFADADRPNGIAFDKAQTTLYVSLTTGPAGATPQLIKYTVNATTGALEGKQKVADLATGSDPDGITVDDNNNIFVAEKVPGGATGRVEVFKPDGTKWGVITVAKQATNVTHGAADRKTLYITTVEGLYSVPVGIPGITQ